MRDAIWGILLVGCVGDTSDWQPVTYVDEGQVCFQQVDGDVEVHVRAPGCLSSSCSRGLSGSCEVVIDENQITVTSQIMWEEDVGAEVCTTDCRSPTVTCILEGTLDNGSYTVIHGEDITGLTAPVGDNNCDMF